ncbi:type II secretion system F family protein [Clostridiaceae bacterium M8S5]|nr:type II secretion system F family protein [Clostridiaceae bacterium M8S5]
MKAIMITFIAGIISLSVIAIYGKLTRTSQNIDVKEYELRDYNKYKMTINEKLIYIFIAGIILFGIGYVFYRNVILSLMITPIALKYPSIKVKELIKKQKKMLEEQFNVALYSISSSLIAGKSVESSFKSALSDLKLVYIKEDTFILKEFEYIIRKLKLNEPIEDVLLNFKSRAHLEDISNFVDVFVICKRTGGNLVDIIKTTTDTIADKIHIKQDIEIMLAKKKFEQKILGFMPVFLVIILSYMAPGYMKPVFDTTTGHIVMTISLVIFIASYIVAQKIINIEV